MIRILVRRWPSRRLWKSSRRRAALLALAGAVLLPLSTLARPAALAAQEVSPGRLIEFGGYGGPVVKFSRVHDDYALLVGARGGWYLNHRILLVGGGYGLVTEHIHTSYRTAAGAFPELRMGYGGFVVEYVSHSDEAMHLTVGTLVGGGSVGYDRRGALARDTPSDVFFLAEPEATLEVNVLSFVRLGAGASWRFVEGVRLPDVRNRDLSGPAASVLLKFGAF